jgi:hypothetical protein
MSVGQVKKQLESGRGVRRALLEYTESLNHDK